MKGDSLFGSVLAEIHDAYGRTWELAASGAGLAGRRTMTFGDLAGAQMWVRRFLVNPTELMSVRRALRFTPCVMVSEFPHPCDDEVLVDALAHALASGMLALLERPRPSLPVLHAGGDEPDEIAQAIAREPSEPDEPSEYRLEIEIEEPVLYELVVEIEAPPPPPGIVML